MIECRFLEKIQISEDIASKLRWDEEDLKELKEKHHIDVYNCKDMLNSMGTLDECEDCPFAKRIKKFQKKFN